MEDDLGGDGVEMVEHGNFPSTKEAHGDEKVEPTPICLIDELVPIPCEHESHLAHLSESDSELSDFHPICEFECFRLEDMSDTQSELREVDDRSMEDIAFANTLTSPSMVSSYVALGSTEDEFPIMETMYMVHEDDDISPCLLQDGHVDHMDPPTSTTPTSNESAYKGNNIGVDDAMIPLVDMMPLECMHDLDDPFATSHATFIFPCDTLLVNIVDHVEVNACDTMTMPCYESFTFSPLACNDNDYDNTCVVPPLMNTCSLHRVVDNNDNISNVDPNNVPLASLVAQEENVDVNFIKNNNFNNNAYRNNSGNNYRPYPSANGNGYGNSYGNSYNNNRSVPPGLEAMLKEFISTQTAFNKSVEEKLDKIDILASKVDRLASDVDLLKLKVMPNKDIENKIVTTANAIQVRINENIRLMAELRARWDREENEKLAKENNVAKVWTITTTSNDNDSHVATPPTINGKIIGVGNVSTPSAKRTKLPEIAKTAETACDKTAEIFSNIGDDDPIVVAHNDLDFDDCHISEVIKFLQKLAKSPNASAINLAFTKHITNALIKAREEKLKLETSIPRKLEDGWEPIIKMRVNDFDCNALCDLGASISVMPKKVYDMLDLPPLKNCYLDVNLVDNAKKKPLGRVDNVRIMGYKSSLKPELTSATTFDVHI
ncbi:hypothetical protein QYE76_029029 [Lolium multiflorum]|uniref:Reverse transcriptase domain-containing protein n=1 Tax=Lolium multiflorum TaxID=4521 RepID=A0AAD8QM30_LOLMU|nr:hypothetical protein QYE76_029029 [Lolium multiflorum]